MPRIKSTLFRPIPGTAYIVVNTMTNEKIICHILKASDSTKYGEVRSGRSCRRGNEYFKIFVNGKVYKMNNSLNNGTCLSEDKTLEFIGEKPVIGTRKAKSQSTKDKKPKKATNKANKPSKTSGIEFVSIEALSKII